MNNRRNGNESIKLVANIFYQGDRIVYSTNFSFDEVAKYIKPTEVREVKDEPVLENLLQLENRFRNTQHVKSIYEYVIENPHKFILPSITMLSRKHFKLTPIAPTWEEINHICNEEVSAV
ncbi:hypothetical protein B4N84_19915, partial [Flavobacterium sp. IR1]